MKSAFRPHGHTFLSRLRRVNFAIVTRSSRPYEDFMAISRIFTLGGFTVISGFHGHLEVLQKYRALRCKRRKEGYICYNELL